MKHKNKEFYDRQTNEIDIKINDLVLIKNEPYNKFKQVYSGPFTVIKIKHPNVIVRINEKEYELHKNRIIRYRTTDNS